MITYPEKELRALWGTIDKLLAPDGCPWDKDQRAEDLARYLIDEGHEWREAFEQGNKAGQAEELGDLAYLLLFALRLLSDEAIATPDEVIAGIDEKLRRRHPQIFPSPAVGSGSVPATPEEQLQSWDAIKREERLRDGAGGSVLKELPRSLGALAKSHRYQEAAARVGFDWPAPSGVIDKLHEEIGELQEHLAELPPQPDPSDSGESPSAQYRRQLAGRDLDGLRDELGDLFFVMVNLCRWLDMDAEEVAEAANRKFLRRFRGMEGKLAGSDLAGRSLDEMEGAWDAVKREERQD